MITVELRPCLGIAEIQTPSLHALPRLRACWRGACGSLGCAATGNGTACCRVESPSVYRDRTEEWYFPQLESNKRARFLLGMNETAPEGESETSLKYYGMGDVR